MMLIVWAVVTLYLCVERFCESYGDPVDERKKR